MVYKRKVQGTEKRSGRARRNKEKRTKITKRGSWGTLGEEKKVYRDRQHKGGGGRNKKKKEVRVKQNRGTIDSKQIDQGMKGRFLEEHNK